MDSCLIRVLGDKFDPASIVDKLTMVPYSTFRQGETRAGRKLSKTGGMSFEVGKGPFQVQKVLAIEFLRRHQEELLQVSVIPTIEEFFLEFTTECLLGPESDIVIQRDYLPVVLIRLASDAGLGIVLSSWMPSAPNQAKGP